MFGAWFLGLYPTGVLVWPVGGQLVTLVLTGILLATVAGLLSMRERPGRAGIANGRRAKIVSTLATHDRRLPSAA